ncbi:hypothetical protein BV25DRAFT_1825449 [Artomyces pyxidatus]|uniref:Uncharacterized protein n=1 Tax=Artomyces pyxidatus TaxID=48021 RepID=A0ACB8T2K5_9AGAM|nr:hypothetical protein BV25DRAFT_1825449 [Artomyces pyxidatus]
MSQGNRRMAPGRTGDLPEQQDVQVLPRFQYRGLKESALGMGADLKNGGYLN